MSEYFLGKWDLTKTPSSISSCEDTKTGSKVDIAEYFQTQRFKEIECDPSKINFYKPSEILYPHSDKFYRADRSDNGSEDDSSEMSWPTTQIPSTYKIKLLLSAQI